MILTPCAGYSIASTSAAIICLSVTRPNLTAVARLLGIAPIIQ